MSMSRKRRRQDHHRAALDLIEACTLNEDADIANISAALVSADAQGACYALAGMADAALQLWADDTGIEKAEALARLRARVTSDLDQM